MGTCDGLLDQPQHRRVFLVEGGGENFEIAIDTEGRLGEIVRADREAVEQPGKLVDQHHVGRDFAHDVNL